MANQSTNRGQVLDKDLSSTSLNKWLQVKEKKCKAILKILKGLTVQDAKKVLESTTIKIESNAVVN